MSKGQLKPLKLSRQRQLQDHRKVLCELGATVKKNVGKLARKNRGERMGNPGGTWMRGRNSVTVLKRKLTLLGIKVIPDSPSHTQPPPGLK